MICSQCCPAQGITFLDVFLYGILPLFVMATIVVVIVVVVVDDDGI